MDNEPYRDLTHDEAAQEIADGFEDKGFEVKHEFLLPNGRIADLMVLTPQRDLLIIEVKSFYKPSYVEAALVKYQAYCHSLWLAVPGLLVIPRNLADDITGWRPGPRGTGIMGVDRNELRFLRFPDRRAMPPKRYEELYCLFCQT